MKINNEDYIYEILTKLFGEDLIARLMSNNINDDLLEAIQNSINEIESFKKEDEYNYKKKSDKNINKTYNEIIEERPKTSHVEKLMSKKIKNSLKKSNSSKKINYKTNNGIYKEFNFVKSLRKNVENYNFGQKNEIMINNNKIKIEKPFINATSPYGNYFDAPLQNGGLSKLGVF